MDSGGGNSVVAFLSFRQNDVNPITDLKDKGDFE
jgi:hypothetical protein